MLAILYTVLFCAGLYPVTALYKQPYWPGPWEPASVIVPYFQTYGGRVLFCVFLQLGAMICLGIFTATIISRLHFLGARAAGVYIALFGGFLVVFDAMAGSMAMWTLLRPAVLDHPPLLLALYYLGYGLGGPGFSIPMGLLMAGVSVTAAFMKLLPKWVIVLGLILAAAGELSWFHLVAPSCSSSSRWCASLVSSGSSPWAFCCPRRDGSIQRSPRDVSVRMPGKRLRLPPADIAEHVGVDVEAEVRHVIEMFAGYEPDDLADPAF
jgi:hypothetical protein